ncbi:hypothetical protein [Streptosporangium vulgare]|uniref:hypothetical protein n=1 Tax=Streptosporangium vulgare TaxID=46190 RepID=UPI0031D36445
MTDSPADPAPEIGEISVSGWYAHTDKMAKVGFLDHRPQASGAGVAGRQAGVGGQSPQTPRSRSP